MEKYPPHEGTVYLRNSFDEAWKSLKERDETRLETESGKPFKAKARVTVKSKLHPNENYIEFVQYSKKEGKWKAYARSYSCCWGHYRNCSRTMIGTYCEALDAAI